MEGNIFPLRLILIEGGNFVNKSFWLDALRVEGQLSGIGKGKCAQVIDEMFKPCCFLADDFKVFFCGRQYTVVYGFGMTENEAERCAEFMGDIGCHLFARID